MKFYKGTRRLFDTIEKESSISTFDKRYIDIQGVSNISDLKNSVIQVLSYADSTVNSGSAPVDTTFYIRNGNQLEVYSQSIKLPKNWASKNQIYNIYITEDLTLTVFGANISETKESSSTGDGTPVGSGMDFFGTTPPENYMFADGSWLYINEYPELYEVIGHTYSDTANANVSTQFQLPDKRTRVSVMMDSGTFSTLGAKGGEESHILTTTELASHTHIQNSHSHTFTGTASSGSGNLTRGGQLVAATMVADGGQDRKYRLQGETGLCTNTDYYNVSVSITPKGSNQSTTAVNQDTGGNLAHNNLQPYLVCNYIVKVK